MARASSVLPLEKSVSARPPRPKVGSRLPAAAQISWARIRTSAIADRTARVVWRTDWGKCLLLRLITPLLRAKSGQHKRTDGSHFGDAFAHLPKAILGSSGTQMRCQH